MVDELNIVPEADEAGIQMAASYVPRVRATVVSFVEGPRHVVAANDANLPTFGEGYGAREGFVDFHGKACEEVEAFDYKSYRKSGFCMPDREFPVLAPKPAGVAL